MKKRIEKILQEVLDEIQLSKDELSLIENSLNNFLDKIKKQIDKRKVKVDVFVGGSFAKKTLIKKEKYDIDIFLRFDKKYSDEDISKLTKKILRKARVKFSLIHGSRDYFRINTGRRLYFEVVPVMKVSKPNKARNITDLSYSHVKYVNKKAKNKKIKKEIMLAKKFCQANECYGAESYINGFSGYSLELLVLHYKSFVNFLRKVSLLKKKEIIDIEKLHRGKAKILRDLNSSKLQSPIVLIDPTFKQRNALAALSDETLDKFQLVAQKFLKSPSRDFFEKKVIDLDDIRKKAIKKKEEFLVVELKTNKQAGDIAGSKLFKFYRHLIGEIELYFDVRDSGFNYNDKKVARCFFVVKRKKEIILDGPFVRDKKNYDIFKKKHSKVFTKKGKAYAKQKINFSLKEFVKIWKKKNKRKIKGMSVKKIRLL